eukprot:INCI3032.1.p1 GENE.INCI3032.1~~INCI3032.1.p1  ORF type:complete len:153 (+),score=28.27 INCI3032.1:271-729(+)
MIRFFLLQNKQGKTRVSRWYVPVEFDEKLKVENEVHRIIVGRNAKFTNFIEFKTYKLVYRRYAGLYFTIACDVTDNELSYLELIHLFVETLDEFFGNVCELDIVFNFQQVYRMLDELINGGEIVEISKRAIYKYTKHLDRLQESEKGGIFGK